MGKTTRPTKDMKSDKTTKRARKTQNQRKSLKSTLPLTLSMQSPPLR
jgi:hypothetical protein